VVSGACPAEYGYEGEAMQHTQQGWVVVGIATLLGVYAVGTAIAQQAGATTPSLAQHDGSSGNTTAAPDKATTAQPWYEAIAERTHVGGYASFRYETNDLHDAKNGFDFRRFVLALDARPAERLHFNFELEFERFTVLELERSIATNAQGIAIEQVSKARMSRNCALNKPGRSTTSLPG
jgi:hypothetical protein